MFYCVIRMITLRAPTAATLCPRRCLSPCRSLQPVASYTEEARGCPSAHREPAPGVRRHAAGAPLPRSAPPSPTVPHRSTHRWKSASVAGLSSRQSYRDILGLPGFRVTSSQFSSTGKGDDKENGARTVSVRKAQQYLDVQSLVKTLTSLNIDIPGMVGSLQRRVPKIRTAAAKQETRENIVNCEETKSSGKLDASAPVEEQHLPKESAGDARKIDSDDTMKFSTSATETNDVMKETTSATATIDENTPKHSDPAALGDDAPESRDTAHKASGPSDSVAQRWNQYWSDDVRDLKREQFTFEGAMRAAHDSVRAYFLERDAAENAEQRRKSSSTSVSAAESARDGASGSNTEVTGTSGSKIPSGYSIEREADTQSTAQSITGFTADDAASLKRAASGGDTRAGSGLSSSAPDGRVAKKTEHAATASGPAAGWLVDQLRQYLPSTPFTRSSAAGAAASDTDPMRRRLEQLRFQSETRAALDRRTRALVQTLRRAASEASQLQRIEDLCAHLAQHPHAKALCVKESVVPVLLRLSSSDTPDIRAGALKGLSMVGYALPVRGRGVRILSIDGGGTRGLVAIQILRELQSLLGGRPIRGLFDYVCGVSTGALLATMLAVNNVPLDECELLYKQFSKDMFNRSRLLGASSLVTAHAYYDHVIWEKILQETMGVSHLIDSARDADCPKVSLVSTLMNRQTVENYLFRNYTYPEGVTSHYPGSYHHRVWEAIRASSAAPTYYQEFKLGDFIHQDGGVLANNPTAIALHEARLLWPEAAVQCVVSLGTGRYRPTGDPEPTVSLRAKIDKMVQSATDTEAVHTMLQDLLPPSTYFRFNPYLSEDFTLDEIRDEKWEQLNALTNMYLRKNQLKLITAAQVLSQPKQPHRRVRDWVKVTLDERG